MEHKQKPIFIAEPKWKSPFIPDWKPEKPWQALLEEAEQYGDWISFHTEADWGSSLALFAEARKRTKKKLVAKGRHLTDRSIELAFNEGADYVLVVGRVPDLYPDYRDSLLLEPYTLRELAEIPSDAKAVWNSRDLRNRGLVKTETFAQARAIFLGWLCQASNIKTPKDVHPGANAALVGQAMPEFARAWHLRYPR
jgi:indole-3-glycerol phosphate synthase